MCRHGHMTRSLDIAGHMGVVMCAQWGSVGLIEHRWALRRNGYFACDG